MVNFTCNSTLSDETISEVELWNGHTFHSLGLILCAVFGSAATLLSLYLIAMHATHYLKPREQKHIIRILFMVPVYSVASFLSYLFYRHYIYYSVIQQCYEFVAIASFFTLVCHFIAPDLHSQKDYFRTVRPKDWVLPISWLTKCTGGTQKGVFRTPRSGLTWFNIIWFCVYQYCFIRASMSIVAVITQVAGRYCLDSLNPVFAHIWITVIEGLSVSVAMFAIIQFYIQIRADVVEHKVFLKVAAIKLVIFLSFWQTIILDLLSTAGAIKASPTIADPDIKVGIPTMLLCIEMSIFAVLHTFAYPWKPYDVKRSPIVAAETAPGFSADPKYAYVGGRFGYKAILEAANPWDLVKATARGFRWIFVGRKHREQDISYKQNSYESTALADQNNAGKKPGRYYPLSDEDDAGDKFTAYPPSQKLDHDPSPYGGPYVDGEQSSSNKPHPQHYDGHTAYGAGAGAAPGPGHQYRQDSGFQPAPVGGPGQPTYPDTSYGGGAAGSGGQVEMPSPTKWSHAQ